MFESLRKKSAINTLKSLLKTQKRERKTWSLDNAASIAVLFDATSEKTRKEALEWAAELGKNSKKVSLLGFFNDKKPPVSTPDFDFFLLKETSWNYAPKSEKALRFMKSKTDVLLVLNPNQLIPLEWVAVQHPAAMKIGMPTENPHDFDLQIEIPADKGIPYFAQQLKFYLQKIK